MAADADAIIARARAVLNDRGYADAGVGGDADVTVAAARSAVARSSKSREAPPAAAAAARSPPRRAPPPPPEPVVDNSLEAKIKRAEALASARERERIQAARRARKSKHGGVSGEAGGAEGVSAAVEPASPYRPDSPVAEPDDGAEDVVLEDYIEVCELYTRACVLCFTQSFRGEV
jgi:hypothetical protein